MKGETKMQKTLINEITHADGSVARFWMIEIDTVERYEIVYCVFNRGQEVCKVTSEKVAKEYWAHVA